MFNPRFPHSFRAYRASLDEYGNPAVDDNGQPVYEQLMLEACEMFDHEPRLNADGSFVTYWRKDMDFGYRTSSENSRQQGDVVVADYRLACPMFLTQLQYGDVLILKDYTHTIKVEVVKMTTFNIGTNVWVNEVKN